MAPARSTSARTSSARTASARTPSARTPSTGATPRSRTPRGQHTLLDEEQRAAVITRLRRAQGQVGAVIRMLEEDRPCEEVVHQIAAASKAIDTAAFTYLAASLRECVTAGRRDSEEVTAQLQRLFLTLA